MAVLGRPLVALRVARVVEAAAIGVPFDASARGRISHAGNHIVQAAAGRHVVDIRGAVLAAVGGKRHHDALAVVGRPEEVDRSAARRIEEIGVEHDALAADVARNRQGHQHGLILRRLQFQREESAAVLEVVTPHGRRAQQLADASGDRRALRKRVEVAPRERILLRDPAFHFGTRVILEPAKIVDHRHAMIGLGDGTLRGRWVVRPRGESNCARRAEHEAATAQHGSDTDLGHTISRNGQS